MAYKQSPFPRIAGTSSPVKSKTWLAKQVLKYGNKAYKFAKSKLTKSSKTKIATKTATKKPNLQHLTTETGTANKMGVTHRVTTYQDINNPGKFTQIRSSDVGIKGGDFRIYPADKVKLNKMGY
jgi:hypothetical protein